MKGLQMIGSYLNEWNIVTITVRLILAVVCGGAIGLTRSVKRRGAGFKTHALVCLGSALVMMTGQYIYVDFGAISDIARLAAQVISGVGFLGVGTIMVTRDNHVKGLTTAAGLWTCAGIGLGIGIGFYSGAAITTILVLVIYRFMGRVDEIAYEHSRVLDIYIEFEYNNKHMFPHKQEIMIDCFYMINDELTDNAKSIWHPEKFNSSIKIKNIT